MEHKLELETVQKIRRALRYALSLAKQGQEETGLPLLFKSIHMHIEALIENEINPFEKETLDKAVQLSKNAKLR